MDEERTIIDSNTRSEKIKNLVVNNKKKLIIIFYYTYRDYWLPFN